jgi:hypothetical protein
MVTGVHLFTHLQTQMVPYEEGCTLPITPFGIAQKKGHRRVAAYLSSLLSVD